MEKLFEEIMAKNFPIIKIHKFITMISRKAWRWIEYMDNTRFLKSERKSGQLNLESLKSQFGLKENWQNATEITYISVELRLRRGHPENMR